MFQAGWNEKPGAASLRVENPARKQPAGWNDEPGAASLRESFTQFMLLLGIGALRVCPSHRHRLTLSSPLPNTLIACVLYVHFFLEHCLQNQGATLWAFLTSLIAYASMAFPHFLQWLQPSHRQKACCSKVGIDW